MLIVLGVIALAVVEQRLAREERRLDPPEKKHSRYDEYFSEISKHLPEDCELVQKLMKVYREETGDLESKPKCIGGGTYAKEMPNMLAFGNQFVGENCHIHEADERWSIDHIVSHTNIMAAAIAALAGVEE